MRSLKLRNYKISKLQNSQRGYMLISLMLIFALMAVALLAVLPSMKQQVQRDREEELCHRGTMYMRAIQHFYKKVGRYPTSVEELENSNHIRYLRKRYKDPMSWDSQAHKERDFKLMHMQDILLNNGPVLGGAPTPGGSPTPGPGSLPGALVQMQQQSPFQSQPNNTGNPDSSGSSNAGNAQGSSGSDSSGSSNPNGSTGAPNSGPSGSPGPNGQVFGGGAIVGVASTNKKDKSIHEFNKKNHYKDWYFIYDSNMDTGKGPLIGPWQPVTIGGGGLGQPVQGTQPAPGSGPGISQPFGAPQSPQQAPQTPSQNPGDNSQNPQ
jgi:type II secretory pathway pseudopilin PulG